MGKNKEMNKVKTISKKEYDRLKELRSIYTKMEMVYTSDKWSKEFEERTMMLYSIEKTTMKKLEPNKNTISEPFTI